MAIEKYSNRNDALLCTKEEYVGHASGVANCNVEDVLVVGCKITEDEAREKVKSLLNQNDASMQLGVNFKLIKALRQANAPIVHKEYYSVIASYFHISEVEFDYSYILNGDVINMSPTRRGANMDFCTALETLDGRYKQSIIGKRTPLNVWENLLESECIDYFEDGFKAHKLLAEDLETEDKESIKMLDLQLNAKLKELIQAELGKARKIYTLNLVDKEYSYVTKILAAPFYIFNYDLGNKIVTISVDAYSGVVGTPVVNNPLGLAFLAKTVEEPYFSVPLCIICGCAVIGLGAVLYTLNYFVKKSKFNNCGRKGAPKYSFEQMKELI